MNRKERRKQIPPLAKKIVALEKKIARGEEIDECQAELTQLTSLLSLEEMLEIDDYIIKCKLLKK